MAASVSATKASSRYNSDSRSSASSHVSDSCSSADLKLSSFRRLVKPPSPDAFSIVKSKPSDLVAKKNGGNIGTIDLVKKLMEKRLKSKTAKPPAALVIPDEIKKNRGNHFGEALHKKLFRKGLSEVKSNTRTLGMVLTSERELLNQNKELELQITQLKLELDDKNSEVEKLKDLCLKQREEIKSLKSAILFPDVMNSQLEELIEKEGSELRQAKQVIPALQKQVTSLTGQVQCLAQDLAEVKADKYSISGSFEGCISSPTTPSYGQEGSRSLEFSFGEPTSPASPDEMPLPDLNPCLTPVCANTKSKEFHMIGCEFLNDDKFYASRHERWDAPNLDNNTTKLCKSSDSRTSPNLGKAAARVTCRSDESKFIIGNKQMHHRLF